MPQVKQGSGHGLQRDRLGGVKVVKDNTTCDNIDNIPKDVGSV